MRDHTASATDVRQRRLGRQFASFLADHPDGVRRSCRSGHITASALVLSADLTQVLLTLHAKERLWLQLGGHCEPEDEVLAAAAVREATEESGIAGLRLLGGDPRQLDRHRVGCHGGSWHYDVQYAAVAPPGALPRLSAESLDLAWFDRDLLPHTDRRCGAGTGRGCTDRDLTNAANTWKRATRNYGQVAMIEPETVFPVGSPCCP